MTQAVFDPDHVKDLTAADLTEALYGSIQSQIEQGKPDNITYHYFMPGIPFGPELASFMDLGPAPKGLDNADGAGAVRFTGNDLARSAVNFARVVDYIPEPGSTLTSTADESGEVVVDLNALVSSGKTISGAYESALGNCKVVNNSLSDTDQERLRKLQALLYKEPVVSPADAAPAETADAEDDIDLDALLGDGMDTGDLVADSSKLRQPTKRMRAYDATRLAFQKVQDEELERRRTISPDDPNAGEVLAASNRRIQAARRRWQILGKKVETEAIMAKIDQLSQGGMPTYVAELRERLEANRIRAAAIATEAGAASVLEDAYYAALRPNGILRAPGMKITLDSSRTASWSSMKDRSTSVQAAFAGIALFAGRGSKSSRERERKFFAEGFRISFEVVQGLIDRPWFDLAFVESDAYTTVDPDTKQPLDEVNGIVELSDGKRPPSGAMPLVPVTVYFVRDVTVRSSAFQSLSSAEMTNLSVRGGASLFGFGIGGSHSARTTTVDTSRTRTHGELVLKGTYLIAVASRLLELAPHPDFDGHPDPQDWI